MSDMPMWVYRPLDRCRAPLDAEKCHHVVYGPHALDVVGRQCSRRPTMTHQGIPVCTIHAKRLSR